MKLINVRWKRPGENKIMECLNLTEVQALARIKNVLRYNDYIAIYSIDLKTKEVKKGETMIPEDLSQIDHNLTAEELGTVCRALEDGIGQIYDVSEYYGLSSYRYELNSYLYSIDEQFDTVSRITRIGIQ